MSTFAISSTKDTVDAVNYLLANMGQGGSSGNVTIPGNVVTANTTTGVVSSGGTIVSYLYRYLLIRYSTSPSGSTGFSTSPTNATYFGVYDSISSTPSDASNPTNYNWTQATGGFGTTKFLWYSTYGGGQVAFSVGTSAPSTSYVQVPNNSNPFIDLNFVTASSALPIIILSTYQNANTTPATPTGGTYDFGNLVFTPPSGWFSSTPSAGNGSIYSSQNTFVAPGSGNVASPTTSWTTPVALPTGGAPGSRGPIPMGYVLTPADPISASTANLISWFSASRNNVTAPIGLGLSPISGDTACFTEQGNTAANIVYTFNGSTFSSVQGSVVNGNVFVTGSVNAAALNANDVYALTMKGGPVTPGTNSGAGFWLTAANVGNAVAGDAYMGGNVYIGNNLTVAGLITGAVLNTNTVDTTQVVPQAVSDISGAVGIGTFNINTGLQYANVSITITTSISNQSFIISGMVDLLMQGSSIGVNYNASVYSVVSRNGTPIYSGSSIDYSWIYGVPAGTGSLDQDAPIILTSIIDSPNFSVGSTVTYQIGVVWSASGAGGRPVGSFDSPSLSVLSFKR